MQVWLPAKHLPLFPDFGSSLEFCVLSFLSCITELLNLFLPLPGFSIISPSHISFRRPSCHGTEWTWSSSSDGCDCVMYVCREWTWDCISMLWAIISTKLCIDEGWSARYVEYDTIPQEMLSRCVRVPKSWWRWNVPHRTRKQKNNGKELLLHYIHLMAFFQDNLGKSAPER